jgi:hypothetical protein
MAGRSIYSDPEVRELLLFSENEKPLYMMEKGMRKSIARVRKQGIYSSERALVGWQRFINEAARRYDKEFGHKFTLEARKKAARAIRDYTEGLSTEELLSAR